jgi:hypothetical protein
MHRADFLCVIIAVLKQVNYKTMKCILKMAVAPGRSQLGGSQSRSGRCSEERSLLPPPGIKPQSLGRPVRRYVNVQTLCMFSPVLVYKMGDMFRHCSAIFTHKATLLALDAGSDPTDRESLSRLSRARF